MSAKSFLVIGDVFTDYHLDKKENELRLGGVFHTARAFDALNEEYSLAIFYSEYQLNQILKWANVLNCKNTYQVGKYCDKPNVMLVTDSVESGNQEYREILYKQPELSYNFDSLIHALDNNKFTDIILYPGDFDNEKILELLKKYNVKIHVDTQYHQLDIKGVTTIFTSSTVLSNEDSLKTLIDQYQDKQVVQIVLKENRGGSRYYNYQKKQLLAVPAYQVMTEHSVGVGDVFNAVFLSGTSKPDPLNYASLVSAVYANTLDHDYFTKQVDKINRNNIELIPYNSLPWEERPNIKIYIAAPDFPNSLTSSIVSLIESKMSHHNFEVIRPIRDFGLVTFESTRLERLIMFHKDKKAIYSADICIAVLEEYDTGTATEIGLFHGLNKPIIAYSQSNRELNNFLLCATTIYTHSVVELVESVFKYAGK